MVSRSEKDLQIRGFPFHIYVAFQRGTRWGALAISWFAAPSDYRYIMIYPPRTLLRPTYGIVKNQLKHHKPAINPIKNIIVLGQITIFQWFWAAPHCNYSNCREPRCIQQSYLKLPWAMALRWVLANGYSNWDLSTGWFKRTSTGNPIFHGKIHGLVVYNSTRSNQLANHDYVSFKYQDGHAASIHEWIYIEISICKHMNLVKTWCIVYGHPSHNGNHDGSPNVYRYIIQLYWKANITKGAWLCTSSLSKSVVNTPRLGRGKRP